MPKPWWRRKALETGEKIFGLLSGPLIPMLPTRRRLQAYREKKAEYEPALARGKVRKRAAKLLAQGMSPEAVDKAIRREFGNKLRALEPKKAK